MSSHQYSNPNYNRNSNPDMSSAWHAQAPPPPPSLSKQPHRRLSYIPQGALNIQPGSIINDPNTAGGNLPPDSFSPSPQSFNHQQQQRSGPVANQYQYNNPTPSIHHQQQPQINSQYGNTNHYHQHQQQQQHSYQNGQQFQQQNPMQGAPYQQTRPLPAPAQTTPYNQQSIPQNQPHPTLHHSTSWNGNPQHHHHQQQQQQPYPNYAPPPPQPQQIQPQIQPHQQSYPTSIPQQSHPNPIPTQVQPGPSSVGSIRRNLPQPPSVSSQPQPQPTTQQPSTSTSTPPTPSPATLSRTQTLRNAAEDIMSRGPPRRGAVKPLWNAEGNGNQAAGGGEVGNSVSNSSLNSNNSIKSLNGNAVGVGAGNEELSNSLTNLKLNKEESNSSSPIQSQTFNQSNIQSSHQETSSTMTNVNQSPILRSPSPSYAGRPKKSNSPSVPPLSSSSTFNNQSGGGGGVGSRPVSRRNSIEQPNNVVTDQEGGGEVATFVRPPSRGPREDVKLGRERRQSTEIFIRSSSPNPERNGSISSGRDSNGNGFNDPQRSDSLDSNKYESPTSQPPARYEGFLPQSQVSNQPIINEPNSFISSAPKAYESNSSRSQPPPPQIQVGKSTPIPTINTPSIVEPPNSQSNQSPSFNFSGPEDDEPIPSIVVPTINLPGDDDSSSTPMISISSVEDDSISESGNSSTSGISNGGGPSISISHSGQIATPQRASSSSNTNHPDPISKNRNPHQHQNQHQAASPSSIGSGSNCGKCGKWSGGRVLNAMNQIFHPQCFTCNHCSTNLEHVAFYEFEGKPYCHFDFHELFSIRCFHCRTPIVDERFIRIKDDQLNGTANGNGDGEGEGEGTERFYHELHFFCANCGDPFLDPKAAGSAAGSDPNMVQADENGRVVFGGMGFVVKNGYAYCEKCHKNLHYPRCKTCKLPILTEVLTALGSKYHPECFTCDSCGNAFQDERMFVRGKNKYDEECYKILLKNEL